MKNLYRQLSIVFSSGALGGIANGLIIWLFGILGVTAAANVSIAPALTTGFLYNKIVWGGIWGAILMIPIFQNKIIFRGIILSIAPSLIQLIVVFPLQGKGAWGLQLGILTPIFVFLFNSVWGIVSVLLHNYSKFNND